MIHFPTLTTPRFQADFRELTIAEECQLLAMPEGQHERAAGALLKLVLRDVRGAVTDPRRWTVQERMLAVAHYMACVSDDSGNFAVGDTEDSGHFLDYLLAEQDRAPESVPAGNAVGSAWHLHQLTGAQAEAMDGLCGTRLQWVAADMAARMHAEDDTAAPPDAVAAPAAYTDWLRERIATIEALPASQFGELCSLYRAALPGLQHLFRLEFDGLGHVARPRDSEGRRATMAPARFPVAAAVTEFAQALCR